MRVLVTGGRDFTNAALMAWVLWDVQVTLGPITEIIHGDATGADHLAGNWAFDSRIPSTCEQADWNQGPQGGPERNARMVAMNPDLVVAFPGGTGTADCVRKAKAAGIEVRVVPPDPRWRK